MIKDDNGQQNTFAVHTAPILEGKLMRTYEYWRK
jgi:hypothetical protein